MATNKKLSAEIDRTIKKIQEGIQLFDDIWSKLHNAQTQNLKERFQGELKTEIKKLQRMRDQIKTWQGMSDVRDKRSIDEARRNIEAKMEQFKACEREAKIKTFSKIGLSLPTKEDPEEIAREQARGWLRDAIDQFNQQIEQTEADVSSGKKSRRRLRNDSEATRERLMQYRYHLTKLEQLLRLLDNEQVTPEEIEPLQDIIASYLENNTDPDYDPIEIEGIYDEIIPDDLEEVFPDTPTQPTAVSAPEKKEESKREKRKNKKAEAAAASTASTGGDDSKASTPTTPSIPTPPSHGLPKVTELPPTAAQSKVSPGSGSGGSGTNYAAAAAKLQQSPVASPVQTASVPSVSQSSQQQQSKRSVTSSPVQPSMAQRSPVASSPQQVTTPTTVERKPAQRELSSPVTPTAVGRGVRQQTVQQQQHQSPSVGVLSSPVGGSVSPVASAVQEQQSRPFKPSMNKEQKQDILKMLEQSRGNLPVPEDTRKRSPYVPPNPYKTPSYYPQQPHQAFEQPVNFGHFDTDTLFFIFYYQQSTYQQYLAAKELKRQSWRFHKKYLTWFQRADPPQVVNEEFEQGSYIFFDFEDGWAQRLRKDFTFKYCYLEDELPTSSA